MAPLGVLLVTAQLGLPFVVQAHARRQGASPLPTLDFAMLVAVVVHTLLALFLEVVLYVTPLQSVDANVAYVILLTGAVSVWTALFCAWWMGRKLCEPADLLERAGLVPLALIMFSGAFTPLLSAAPDPLLPLSGALSTTLTFLVVLDLVSAR